MEEEASFSIEASTWDTMLFIGLPAVGFMGSLSMVLAAVVNIILQVSFCLVIYYAFLAPPSPTPEEAMLWRLTTGHSIVHIDGWLQSHVNRICKGDSSVPLSLGLNQ